MKDGLTILYITLGAGGIIGGILTAINKTRYVKKEECDKDRTNFCTKVDELRADVRKNLTEVTKMRREDQEKLNGHLMDISKFIGKVEQHMKVQNGRGARRK